MAEVEHSGVNHGEIRVRVLGGNRSCVPFEEEAHTNDDRVGVSSELEQLRTVRAIVVGRGLTEVNAEFGLGAVKARSGRIVERQVATATDVVDETDGGLRGSDLLGGVIFFGCVRRGVGLRSRVGRTGIRLLVITAGCSDKRERQEHR